MATSVLFSQSPFTTEYKYQIWTAILDTIILSSLNQIKSYKLLHKNLIDRLFVKLS